MQTVLFGVPHAVPPVVSMAGVSCSRSGARGLPSLLVVLNLGHEPHTLEDSALRGTLSLATRLDRENEEIRGALALRGDEGAIIELSQP